MANVLVLAESRGGAPRKVAFETLAAARPLADASTGEVVKWEPFVGQNFGRRLRAWVRPLHTGEAGGIVGQGLAGVGSAGATVLVWTGVSLAWRRLRSFRRRRVPRLGAPAARAGQEVSAD